LHRNLSLWDRNVRPLDQASTGGRTGGPSTMTARRQMP
jgi:hypothetical protein